MSERVNENVGSKSNNQDEQHDNEGMEREE